MNCIHNQNLSRHTSPSFLTCPSFLIRPTYHRSKNSEVQASHNAKTKFPGVFFQCVTYNNLLCTTTCNICSKIKQCKCIFYEPKTRNRNGSQSQIAMQKTTTQGEHEILPQSPGTGVKQLASFRCYPHKAHEISGS
jgi:hypothetical protein